MTRLPPNFISLHSAEEELRTKSLAAIDADEDLFLHFLIIEAAMGICTHLRQFKTDDEDLKVIQLFGMRMFNAFATSIKLIMSGYYQKGALIMRDILETVFLADFFRTDRAAITRWRFADRQQRMKSFSPIRIREALDKRDGYAAKHKAKGNGFGFGLFGPEDVARTLSARYYKDGSEILIRNKKGKNPRRLTPRECARLMGYDDDFKIPVSDTQAYKQFGNSVAVPVIREVARIMLPHVAGLIKPRIVRTSKRSKPRELVACA